MLTARPFFTGFSQSGAPVTIPVGTRAFQVNVLSGSCYVGSAVYYAGQQVSLSLPDSKNLLGYSIPVSISGAGVNAVNVFWVQ